MARFRRFLGIFLAVLLILILLPVTGASADRTLEVKFLPQCPPGDWSETRNCGQTCCVMLEGYYNGTTPTADRIKAVDDWLFATYQLPVNDYNGSYTGVDTLKSILSDMMGFQNVTVRSGQSVQDIKNCLDAGNPVIVPVTKVYQGNTLSHFALIKGYDGTYFYLNDPGRNSTVGPTAKYTFSEFNDSVWQSKKSMVFINRSGGSSGGQAGSAPSTGTVQVDYYGGIGLSGSILWSETVDGISKDWGSGGPGNGVPNDNFSARFTQQASFGGGWYKFHYEVDDAIKIWVDGDCKVDKWGSHVLSEDSDAVYIAGGTHTVEVDYADYGGEAKILVNWYGTAAPPSDSSGASAPAGLPDLAPTAITYDSGSLQAGTGIWLDAGVSNLGGADVESFSVRWDVNGVEEVSGGHRGIAANTTDMDGNSAYYWTPPAAGTYVVQFFVDTDCAIAESDEYNNAVSVTIHVPETAASPGSLPDLAPTAITYDSGSLQAGTGVWLDTGVSNLGGADTGAFSVRWDINGVEEASGGHAGVAANTTDWNGNSAYYWTPPVAGTYVVQFFVDTGWEVTESDEYNNAVSVTIHVPEQAQTNPYAVPNVSTVLVDGSAVAFEAYTIGGNNYFKLRDLAAVLSGTGKQFEVEWNQSLFAIFLTSGRAYTPVGNELSRSGNSAGVTAARAASEVYLDGREVTLTAYTIGGYHYFRLRDVAAAVNFGVTWDGATSTIGIDTSTGYTADE